MPVPMVLDLQILKDLGSLSDENVVMNSTENPYSHHFCHKRYLEHSPPCSPSSLTRWRGCIDHKVFERALKETIDVARREKFAKPSEFSQVYLDTTVQKKNIAFPTESSLYFKGIPLINSRCHKIGIKSKQTYPFMAMKLVVKYGNYPIAKQMKGAMNFFRQLKSAFGLLLSLSLTIAPVALVLSSTSSASTVSNDLTYSANPPQSTNPLGENQPSLLIELAQILAGIDPTFTWLPVAKRMQSADKKEDLEFFWRKFGENDKSSGDSCLVYESSNNPDHLLLSLKLFGLDADFLSVDGGTNFFLLKVWDFYESINNPKIVEVGPISLRREGPPMTMILKVAAPGLLGRMFGWDIAAYFDYSEQLSDEFKQSFRHEEPQREFAGKKYTNNEIFQRYARSAYDDVRKLFTPLVIGSNRRSEFRLHPFNPAFDWEFFLGR